MSEFDPKTLPRYQQAVQFRDWDTCKLMYEEFNFLKDELKQKDEIIKLLLSAVEYVDAHLYANMDDCIEDKIEQTLEKYNEITEKGEEK